jgi:uncharacterized protein YecE (DUF72 family)
LTRAFVGTSGWSYKDWVGPFYPRGTRTTDHLAIYATRFGCVEVDTTFYGIPKATIVERWRNSTPDAFRFSLKAPRSITHEKVLVGTDEELERFLGAALVLREKLECVLFQMPPSFDRLRHGRDLEAFIENLPDVTRYAFELRHRSWRISETADLLGEHDVALVTTDFDKDVNLSADFAYIRFLGKRSDISSLDRVLLDRSEEMRIWVERIADVSADKVFAFFNNHYSGHSPETAAAFVELLASHGFVV